MITLADIEAARKRIAGEVRETPMIAAAPAREPPAAGVDLRLKLESLQVSGSFKARGASNRAALLASEELAAGLVTASSGNHGLGVAYAGRRAGVPVRVYLPEGTPQAKADLITAWHAEVVRHGAVWDESDIAARNAAEAEGLAYIHPFADPAVIAGQGTVGLEIVRALPAVDAVVVAIGGGGLISGVAVAVKTVRPEARVIGVEPTGAPTLFESVRAGRLVTLDAIETSVGVLAPRRSAQINLDIIGRLVDDIVLVGDAEMRAAARWLWREFRIGVELGGAAAVAAVRLGRLNLAPGETVCALVCGAGADGVVDSQGDAG